MPINVKCPSCSTPMSAPDSMAGQMVRCPKCSATLQVPAASAPAPTSPNPAPATTAPAPGASAGPEAAKKSRKGLYIGLGVAGALLLLCCCGGGIALTWYFWPSGTETNDKVTEANLQKLDRSMSIAEVEKLLGTGKQATGADVRAAYKGKDKEADEQIGEYGKKLREGNVYYWKNGDITLFVTFTTPPKTKDGKAVNEARATGAIFITNSRSSFTVKQRDPLPEPPPSAP
jgi:hypothetical protein